MTRPVPGSAPVSGAVFGVPPNIFLQFILAVPRAEAPRVETPAFQISKGRRPEM